MNHPSAGRVRRRRDGRLCGATASYLRPQPRGSAACPRPAGAFGAACPDGGVLSPGSELRRHRPGGCAHRSRGRSRPLPAAGQHGFRGSRGGGPHRGRPGRGQFRLGPRRHPAARAPDRPRSTPGCGCWSDAPAGVASPEASGKITLGELVIDEGTYTARLRGRPLDLTYKEFELLKYLAQHAGRVFTRAQLLQEVWGYDFFGGTRTVDVHVRRLRAKLGTEYESLIGTVRNVGYKAVRPTRSKSGSRRCRPSTTSTPTTRTRRPR